MAKRGKRKRKTRTGKPAKSQAEPRPKTGEEDNAPPVEIKQADPPKEIQPGGPPPEEKQPAPPPPRETEQPAPPPATTAATEGEVRPAGLTAFLRHLHPARVRRRSLTLGATLGLGLATAVSLAIVTVSGILLTFYYVPSVERAHGTLQDLMSVVPLGRFLRNLHRWSAHAAVVFCVLHMLRALLWGSFRGAHARVWLIGVGLLVTVVATSFSGYLLPWDQDAYWTVTVGTSLAGYVPGLGDAFKQLLLGGDTVGQATLTRYFMLHVMALPVFGAILLALHLFRLRRAGGLARAPEVSGPGEELVAASPHLTVRELSLTLITLIVLVLLAALVDARLGPAPDLLRPDNPPKAPWFLVGFQEMVSYSAVVGGFLFPAMLLALLFAGPWLDGGRDNEGAPLTGGGSRLVGVAAVALALGSSVAAVWWWGDPQQGTASWINPATISGGSVLVLGGVILLLRRSRRLAYLAVVIGLLATLALFTAVGWLFRGADWTLTYHPGPGHPSAHQTKPGGPP